jgi:hypothetical protein
VDLLVRVLLCHLLGCFTFHNGTIAFIRRDIIFGRGSLLIQHPTRGLLLKQHAQLVPLVERGVCQRHSLLLPLLLYAKLGRLLSVQLLYLLDYLAYLPIQGRDLWLILSMNRLECALTVSGGSQVLQGGGRGEINLARGAQRDVLLA